MGKVGIALGGGGMRGFAHLGVMKALAERGLTFDAFAGTSAGAIVAALSAAEVEPDEIMDIMKDIKISNAARIMLPKDGFASLDNLRKRLDEILDQKDFSDLPHPLFLAVANLNTGSVEYIKSGNVALAVQASSSIPMLFTPVEMDGHMYVDGGLLDNVPVTPLLDSCEKIVAVDIMPVEPLDEVHGLIEIAFRTFQMSVSMQDEERGNPDLLIRVEGLEEYHILDSNQNEKIYDIGYEYAKNLDIPDLKKLGGS